MAKKPTVKTENKSTFILNNRDIAVYIRVSTENESQKESLVNQKAYFDQFIGENKYDLYCDEGLSAAIKLEKRYAFIELLKNCGVEINRVHNKEDIERINNNLKPLEKGKLQAVSNRDNPKYKKIYIKSTSRFARHFIGESILTELKKKNVALISRQNNLDSSIDADWIKFLGAINTDTAFSKNLSESVKFGFDSKIQQKLLTNVRYYGTKPIRKGKYVEKYEIIEEEAKAVQLIYEWYLNGIVDDNGNIIAQPLGFKAIATELNKREYPTLYGKPWHQGTVQKLMANEKYKGFYNGGKYDGSRIDNPDRNSSKIRDDYTCYPHDGIPEIVTPEIWDACAEKRKQKEIAITRTQSTNQSTKYGGLIYCGLCGSKYKHNKTLRSKKNSNEIIGYYVCKNKKDNSVAHCSNHNVLDAQLDELINSLCNGGYTSEVELELLSNTQKQVLEIGVQFHKLTKNKEDTDRIDYIKNELTSIEVELKSKINLYGKPGLDDKYLDSLINELTHKKLTLFDELELLQINPTKSVNKIVLCLSNIENLLNEHKQVKQFYTQREVIAKIAKIVVYPDSKYNKPNRYSKPFLKVIYKNQLTSKDNLGFTPLNNSNYELDLSLLDDDYDFSNVPIEDSFKHKKKWSGRISEEDELIIDFGTVSGTNIQNKIEEYLTRQKLKLEKFKEVL